MSARETRHREPERADSGIRRLLLIAFHFPPIQGSSGVHRSLAFARYLPAHGWQPTVLTVRPLAYPSRNDENLALVPPGLPVVRSLAFDTQRHLSLFGQYPRFMALPDRWRTWVPFGTARGMDVIKRSGPAAIMSTFPIASAHVIAHKLKTKSGLPWIADFRDPMIFENYPKPGPLRSAFEAVEQLVFRHATRIVVTTPGAADMYSERYGKHAAGKLCVIENGFDEAIVQGIDSEPADRQPGDKLRILHSGLVYTDDRDPRPLFRALAELIAEGRINKNRVEIAFRASKQESFLADMASELGVAEAVKLLPAIDYRSAVLEMRAADGLLLLQAASCNRQIPGKAYEYLSCNRPILALTDPNGDTGRMLGGAGIRSMAALEDERGVKSALQAFVERADAGCPELPDLDKVGTLSRRARTAELAQLLDGVTVGRENPPGRIIA